jgi:hypothetical protein
VDNDLGYYNDAAKRAQEREDATQSLSNLPAIRRRLYEAESYMGIWPPLLKEMRNIGDQGSEVGLSHARRLLDQAINHAIELDRVCKPVLQQLHDCRDIVVLPDTKTPVGWQYDFSSMDAQRYLETYLLLRIVLNRVMRAIYDIISEPAPEHLDAEHGELSFKIWMSLPYMRRASLMAAILFGDPLYISYEASSGEVREYLLDYLMEIAQFRKRLPDNREVVSRYLLDAALAMTGRSAFPERPDFPYWKYRDEGAQGG